ncbi:hypothetical protein HY468_02940 [Candidatus Roizmanbacteria bacterium]|nr:hypothetical protein [Candidatus Roizmanbacteria bacterium]
MAKLFYDHLIVIEEITAVLDAHEMTKEEREQLLATIDETLYHHVLDVILTHLPREHHETFLEKLSEYPHHPKLLEFIKEKTIVDIEKEIIKTADKIKKKILKDIEELKQ